MVLLTVKARAASMVLKTAASLAACLAAIWVVALVVVSAAVTAA